MARINALQRTPPNVAPHLTELVQWMATRATTETDVTKVCAWVRRLRRGEQHAKELLDQDYKTFVGCVHTFLPSHRCLHRLMRADFPSFVEMEKQWGQQAHTLRAEVLGSLRGIFLCVSALQKRLSPKCRSGMIISLSDDVALLRDELRTLTASRADLLQWIVQDVMSAQPDTVLIDAGFVANSAIDCLCEWQMPPHFHSSEADSSEDAADDVVPMTGTPAGGDAPSIEASRVGSMDSDLSDTAAAPPAAPLAAEPPAAAPPAAPLTDAPLAPTPTDDDTAAAPTDDDDPPQPFAARVRRLYETYAPKRIAKVPKLLAKYHAAE